MYLSDFGAALRFCSCAALLTAFAPADALIKTDDGALPGGREFIGYAYDQKDGKLLYIERHKQELKGSKLLRGSVTYTDPAGKVIARKSLDYRSNPYAPKFQIEDLRSGGFEAGEFLDHKYTIRFRGDRKAELRSRSLDQVKGLVADAGFDNYVRARMHELLRGAPVHCSFVVPKRLESYSFRAAPMGVEHKGGRDLLRIRIEIDNALLRLFVAPVFLVYDVNSGELMEYVGLSNLDDAAASKYRVRTLYPNGQKPGAEDLPGGSTAGGS